MDEQGTRASRTRGMPTMRVRSPPVLYALYGEIHHITSGINIFTKSDPIVPALKYASLEHPKTWRGTV